MKMIYSTQFSSPSNEIQENQQKQIIDLAKTHQEHQKYHQLELHTPLGQFAHHLDRQQASTMYHNTSMPNVKLDLGQSSQQQQQLQQSNQKEKRRHR